MKPSICLLAIIVGLTSCDNQHEPDTNSHTQDDPVSVSAKEDVKDSLDDALIAPAQPMLAIDAVRETLLFSWQAQQQYQFSNLYQYDTSTGDETLIQGGISSPTSVLSLPSHTPQRAWHTQQFRVELCDATDCVSSDRMAIDSLVSATVHTLRPGVFIQGERFAESIAANDDASVLISTLPVAGSIQIHFRHQNQWTATPPVRLESASTSAIMQLSSSSTGDTLAVLIGENVTHQRPSNIRILERLGEAWIPTSELPVPADITVDGQTRLNLSADAQTLYLHTPEQLLIFQRGDLDWSFQSSINAPPDGTLAATSAGVDTARILALVRQPDGLWLTSYEHQNPQSTSSWQATHRHLLQGVDAIDEVFLQTNIDGSSIIVAGWDGTSLNDRSAVLWRYDLHGDAVDNNTGTALTIVDSIRTAPTPNSDARLRFSASAGLETAAVGWSAQSSDDAQLSTVTFNDQQRRYSVALELPHSLTTLAKQSFGSEVVLSMDGRTLLISTLANGSTPSSNKAGELLVFR